MKKIMLFTLLAYCFTSISVLAQKTFKGNLTLTKQSQIDNFSFNIIEGTLTIEGDDIVNIKGMSSLTKISRSLKINCHKNQKIDGFNNLISVGGWIDIRYNTILEEITGFQNLKFAESIYLHAKAINGFNNLEIVTSNLDLTFIDNLNAFSSLKRIGGNLKISQCENLSKINGFNLLESVGYSVAIIGTQIEHIDCFQELFETGSISIGNNKNLKTINSFLKIKKVERLTIYNNSLESISCFQNLEIITKKLTIEQSRLKNLMGLNNVKVIGDNYEGPNFIIMNNLYLESLDALINVRAISYSVDIINNPLLKSLDGLDNINVVPWITIRNNSSLTDFCGIKKMTSGEMKFYDVHDNAYNPEQLDIISGNCKATN